MIKIYYCDIFDVGKKILDYSDFSLNRKKYIDSINDGFRKAQSVAVWKLLLYALKRDFYVEKPSFLVCDGKWSLEGLSFEFSLSHSNNVVCVAVSNNGAVGVDVELCCDKLLKIANSFGVKQDEPDVLLKVAEKWTEKESIFKSNGGKVVLKRTIIDDNSNEYFLTASGIDNECSVEKVNIQNLSF